MLSINMKVSSFFRATFIVITSMAYTTHAEMDWRDVGDILQAALPASAYGTSLLKQDTEGLWQFTEAYSVSIASAYGMKYIVQRERPNGSVRSFPSGHTTSAFSAATFLQRRYGTWYGVPAYAFAALTGYSRVKSHQHWTSDVVAGAAIGVAANFIFTDRYHAKIIPMIEDETRGLQIEVVF